MASYRQLLTTLYSDKTDQAALAAMILTKDYNLRSPSVKMVVKQVLKQYAAQPWRTPQSEESQLSL